MKHYKYIFSPFDVILPEIIEQYKLQDKIHLQMVTYTLVLEKRCVVSLKLAKLPTINYKNILQNLDITKVKQSIASGRTNPETKNTLVVDNFGVKYT